MLPEVARFDAQTGAIEEEPAWLWDDCVGACPSPLLPPFGDEWGAGD